MNCLGIGPSQGSTNLVPGNMILNNSSIQKINTDFIESLNSLKKPRKSNKKKRSKTCNSFVLFKAEKN